MTQKPKEVNDIEGNESQRECNKTKCDGEDQAKAQRYNNIY
jgi:hypothetical protein